MRGGNTKLRYGATNGKTGAASSVAKAIVRAWPPSACACAQRRAATYVCVLSGLGGCRAHAPAGPVAARASLWCSAPARRALPWQILVAQQEGLLTVVRVPETCARRRRAS